MRTYRIRYHLRRGVKCFAHSEVRLSMAEAIQQPEIAHRIRVVSDHGHGRFRAWDHERQKERDTAASHIIGTWDGWKYCLRRAVQEAEE